MVILIITLLGIESFEEYIFPPKHNGKVIACCLGAFGGSVAEFSMAKVITERMSDKRVVVLRNTRVAQAVSSMGFWPGPGVVRGGPARPSKNLRRVCTHT